MRTVFKSALLIYYISASILAIFIVLFGVDFAFVPWDKTVLGLKPWHPVISILAYIFSIAFSAKLAETYARKKHDKIYTILNDECDPQKFLQVYQKIVGRGTGKNRSFTYFYNGYGYYELGDFQTARQQFDLMYTTGLPKTFGAAQYIVFYHLYVCDILLYENDIDNAEQALLLAMEAVKNPKLSKKGMAMSFGQYIMARQMRLNMEKGNYEGSEQFFTTSFEISDTIIKKVINKFHLGRVYLHYNRIVEAKAAFEYVKEHGNKTFYVDRSINFIKQCTEK